MQKKILILEDEKGIARLYAKCLMAKEYDVVLAFDGLEGLEKLKEFEPDLIMLDIAMPRMSGLEFYQRICGPNGRPKYPVLVLTGRADMETMFQAFHIDGFIVKPFDGKRLINEVDIIINNQYSTNSDGRPRKIIIVDDEEKSAGEILSVFSNAGYKTGIATSGRSGIARIMIDPPDLALVNLSLGDLPGDQVILRMQQMVKTRRTRALLYVKKNFKHDKTILEHFASKRGVKLMLEYGESSELLNAAIEVFHGSEGRN